MNTNITTRKKLTNRISVISHEMYIQVIITPPEGKQVNAFFSSSRGTKRDATAHTPKWFISALRDMKDLTKFPHLDMVLDRLASVVEMAGIDTNLKSHTKWGDIELMMFDIARDAVNGTDSTESLANTYRPVLDIPRELPRIGTTVQTVSGGLTEAFFEKAHEVCGSCFTILAASGDCDC